MESKLPIAVGFWVNFAVFHQASAHRCARNCSSISLKAMGFWYGSGCVAMGTTTRRLPGMHRDGHDVIGRPLRERRARLEQVVAGSEFVLPVRRLARNGLEAWSEVIARDCEGYVAKDESTSRTPKC